MSCYQYRKSHCGDKTILRPSYLHNGISYTGKMIYLYWIGAQVIIWTNDGLVLLLYVSLHLNEVNDVYYTFGSGYEKV